AVGRDHRAVAVGHRAAGAQHADPAGDQRIGTGVGDAAALPHHHVADYPAAVLVGHLAGVALEADAVDGARDQPAIVEHAAALVEQHAGRPVGGNDSGRAVDHMTVAAHHATIAAAGARDAASIVHRRAVVQVHHVGQRQAA